MKLYITDFGARGDGKFLCTRAIQSAFDESAETGATVVVPEGIFCCGSLFLRQGMSLELEKGAVLLGSSRLRDYVIEPTRFEGRTCAWPLALLNIRNLSDVHIYGKGIIDGNGYPFWKQFWESRAEAVACGRSFSNRDSMRPRLVFAEQCSNVRIEGITLQNSAFWHLHLFASNTILIEGLTIQAPHEQVRAASSDAIDIDACQHVVVRDCTFSTDDDCVCIKGGKGPDAHVINEPTQDILVENCRFGFGHGVITIGSEAALVQDVVVRDCKVDGENTLLRCKFRGDTYQHFQHITFEDIEIRNGGWLFDVQPWVSRQDELMGSNLPSTVSDLVVRRVQATDMQSPGVLGIASTLLKMERIRLESIQYTSRTNATGALIRADVLERQEANPSILSYDKNADLICTDCYFNGELIHHG